MFWLSPSSTHSQSPQINWGLKCVPPVQAEKCVCPKYPAITSSTM